MESVGAICSGWEWECPHCGCFNTLEELYGDQVIECDGCDKEVNVYPT